jgi:hypothetical protein
MTDSTEERKKHKSCTYDERVLPNYGTGEARAKDKKSHAERAYLREAHRPTMKLSVRLHGKQSSPLQNEKNLQIRFLSLAFTLKARKTTSKLGIASWI